MTYQQHPLSAAFPAMSDEDFRSLKLSIESIGVQNPVTLYEGMVIDGWHRYSAANELGMPCPTVELDGGVDPRDFVLAQNKARRHITQAQLALATSAVYQWASVGRPTKPAPEEQVSEPVTNEDMAQLAGVSVATIRKAKVVQEKAAPEVVAAVKAGKLGLSKAQQIAQLPKEQQAEAINKPLPKKEKRTLAGELAKVAQPAEIEGYSTEQRLTDDLAEAHHLIRELRDENAALRAQVNGPTDAVWMEAIQERDQAFGTLQAKHLALQSQFDTLLNERSAMLQQLAYWKKQAE